MKLYLDIFFLVNMGMDFWVLALVSFFQNRTVRIKRLILASAMGALLAVFFILSGIPRYPPVFWLLDLAGGALVVRAAFGRTDFAVWMRNAAVFYLASFVLSGALQYLQSAAGIQGKWAFLMLASGAATYGAYRFCSAWKGYFRRQREYVSFSLYYRGRCLRGKGLVDTGNHLSEPFGGQPVSIGSRIFLEELWTEEEPLFCYIPYHAVGTKRGMLPVFQAESLEFDTEAGRRQLKKPWIAVNEDAVSADGEYELILNPDMLRISIN